MTSIISLLARTVCLRYENYSLVSERDEAIVRREILKNLRGKLKPTNHYPRYYAEKEHLQENQN